MPIVGCYFEAGFVTSAMQQAELPCTIGGAGSREECRGTLVVTGGGWQRTAVILQASVAMPSHAFNVQAMIDLKLPNHKPAAAAGRNHHCCSSTAILLKSSILQPACWR